MPCSCRSPAKSARWPISPRSWRPQRIRKSRSWRRNWSKRRPNTSPSYIGCFCAIPSRARIGPTISIRRCRRNNAGRSIGLIAPVDHPHGFALRARYLAFRLDHDLAGHADQRLDMMRDLVGLVKAVAGETRRQLDLDGHRIERAVARQDDLVVRRNPRKADQDRFHLRGIDVDAANDEHVVVAAGDPQDTHMRAAASAGLVAQTSNVARAVANHRLRFFGQRRDDQLAGRPYRQRLLRFRIDGLEQEMIFPAM